MRIMITGATGYIGRHLCQSLATQPGYQPDDIIAVSLRETPVTQLHLSALDTIVHLSALVHQPNAAPDAYRQINTTQTIQLAEAAKEAGVKHFIFFSTMAVYGGHGSLQPAAALTEHSPCQPDSPYGHSKYAAEQALQAMASDTFNVAIIRPPLVYGPGCPGNMARLQRLVARSPCLPLGQKNNRRSIVALPNLLAMTNAIILQQASGIFLPQDAQPLSTHQLCTLLAQAQNCRTYLYTPPGMLLRIAQRLKPRITGSLFGSLYYDNRYSCQQLDFQPPVSTAQAIQQMCE